MTTIAETLAQAFGHHQAGRLAQAEPLYREVLQADPHQVDALHLLGIILDVTGRSDQAAEHFRAALRQKRDVAEIHNNLGNVLARQGKLAEAGASFREAVRLKPDFAEAHANLGNVLKNLGRVAEAVECYRAAVRLKPGFGEVHTNLGNALKDLGKPEEAVASHREAIRHMPGLAAAHNNLGAVLMDLGQIEAAAQSCREAIRLKPGFAEGHNNLANALKDLGHPQEAAASYREAIRLKADYPEAHNNLAVALQALDQPDAAAASCREAIRLKPDYPEAHNNLAVALQALDQLEAAAAACRESIRLRPNYAAAHNNLAVSLQYLSRPNEAAASFLEAIRLKPDYADAHFNLGQAYLQTGDYERGWIEYEWRWQSKNFATPRLPTSKRVWDGSPLSGCTIFIHTEQGLGDTLQFIRYIPLVQERGGRVIFACPKALARLLQRFAGVEHFLADHSALPSFDVHAPLLSLPRIFSTTLATVPAAAPYIHAESNLVNEWRPEFSKTRSLKVGIAWQGSPVYGRDRLRSIPLEHFTALARVDGVQFFSLQKQYGLQQLGEIAGRLPVVDLSGRLDVAAGPFMDTAAVMMNLDLVIAADTAVAHLAGALGVPVWVALSFVPYWPWLLHREDSPWYPSARLFRQKEAGKWDEVFERMAIELEKTVHCRSLAGASG